MVFGEDGAPSMNGIVCNEGFHTLSFGARYSLGAGVGYNRSYTTLQSFFSLKHDHHGWTPFLDLRGHLFNDIRYAANAGIGARYLSDSMAWGINSYYDYRNTNQFHYNQWGIGLEAIGTFWSLNVNGYLPVGKKRSGFFDRRFSGAASGTDFAFFQGNSLFLSLPGVQGLAAKQEFAFKGVDAKLLFQVWDNGFLSVETGVTPYYFHGAYEKYAAGGGASLIARISDYGMLGFSGSYDNLFHQRGQILVGLSIPFGPRNFKKKYSKGPSCPIPSFFNLRVTRGAERNEIIVVDRHKKLLSTAVAGGTEIAIDPRTGQPYVIWFVNNLSHSEGTFESPFPTMQEAIAVAQPDDIIYVYPGNGSPYDVDILMQDEQLLWGSGFAQTLLTTKGSIVIPAQTASSPTLENSLGGTQVTLANRNTISGFILSVLNAGDTVVGTSIDSLSFINNAFSTIVTTGMNNLLLNDSFGTFLIQNNQFSMNSADTGSLGISLSDTGSASSTLSILNNLFTNHASTAINLNYSGASSPTLDIGGNTFSPPVGVSGTNGINIATSNGTVLAGSISHQNDFSGYTSNAINMNWGGTGDHSLTVAGNTISNDATVGGTNGIFLTTNASGSSSFTASSNQIAGVSNTAIFCSAGTNAALAVNIEGNTIVGTSQVGNNGIQVTAGDTASVIGSIISNTCSENLGGNINGFPNGSSQLTLTVANNKLTGPSMVPVGSFPNGIQFNGSNFCTLDIDVNNNVVTNHSDHGINLFVSDAATINATVNQNTLSVPDTLLGTAGIQVSAGNSSAVTSTYIVTNNSCTGHTNANIQCFPNNLSIIDLTVGGNTLIGPVITPVGYFPQGIQISASNFAQVTAMVNQGNYCKGHSDRGINVFSSDNASIAVVIDRNLVIAPLSTTSTSGITVGGSNSSSVPLNSYVITNNICQGHNNGAIQCFSSQNTQCNLQITNNMITAVRDGISGSSPVGMQVGMSGNAQLLSATISNNKWLGPQTYQSMGTPQGISLGANDAAAITNVSILNNSINFPLASYQANTSPSGIQTYLNNTATISGITISSNTVNFSTSNYASDSAASGIEVNAQNSGVLTDVAILNNQVSFAPLPAALTQFQQSGISAGGSDTASIGTALSPLLIQGNTVNRVEGNGIVLLNASSNTFYMNAFNNSISLGTVQQNEIGIVTVPFGMGQLVATVDGNTVEGNNGGFIGIVATNQGPGCQSPTISNNTVTHVHGSNPSIPIPGLGGGIGAAVLGSGSLSVFITNNGVSGNTPQGIFGLDAEALGGSGNLCMTFQDNHGAGSQVPDNYVLYNPTGAQPSTFTYEDAGGNAGTFSFVPSSSDFTQGTCSTCPLIQR